MVMGGLGDGSATDRTNFSLGLRKQWRGSRNYLQARLASGATLRIFPPGRALQRFLRGRWDDAAIAQVWPPGRNPEAVWVFDVATSPSSGGGPAY